ncbi:uncharacterized protein LOC118433098 isoform X2 [Folsomia candida]|uniref:uncharacterized protein LOC118433098 isoform X2 n=1 Tax=Folsomia candida TaxID=158441 RepID=UPI001605151D|nr:uncharacterized protein LOC118433098 isoform X2 [Folsomia candida]
MNDFVGCASATTPPPHPTPGGSTNPQPPAGMSTSTAPTSGGVQARPADSNGEIELTFAMVAFSDQSDTLFFHPKGRRLFLGFQTLPNAQVWLRHEGDTIPRGRGVYLHGRMSITSIDENTEDEPFTIFLRVKNSRRSKKEFLFQFETHELAKRALNLFKKLRAQDPRSADN